MLLFYAAASEIDPLQYIINPIGQSPLDANCVADEHGYSVCNQSSLLLDSVHGPQTYSDAALQQYYTEFVPRGRVVFRFPSTVDIEVIQVYYYADTAGSRRSRLYFYSIPDDYHPRLNIPQGAQYLGSSADLDRGAFSSICSSVSGSAENVVISRASDTRVLHLSEVNFFNSSVAEEVCDRTRPHNPLPHN